jgi:stage V sporulation protein AD
MAQLEIPYFGVFGACSTMGETLILGSSLVASGSADHVLCVTSSHFASAEKEFRFPLEYGNQRPLSAGWTVTGAGACILGNRKGSLGITAVTPGKIVDYGMKDSFNMGACMAPAAIDTIEAHFQDLGCGPEEYDAIFTGDLGVTGSRILIEQLAKRSYDIQRCHDDCGLRMYDIKKQDAHAGGSGCGCAASILMAYILPRMREEGWKRVLFVPTGALLSKVSFAQGRTIPAIAHAVRIEAV